MLAAFATVQERLKNAVAQPSLKEIVIVTEIRMTHWEFVAEIVPLMLTQMAFVTTSTIASAHLMRAACATVQVKFSSVDVQTFLKATAIAMEINSMPWVCVVEIVPPMPMPMVFVMTSTIV